MTTTAKGQKDKPFATNPRLLPRPTAASAARAARNATNRNVTVSPLRQSPIRTSTPTASPKLQGKSTHRPPRTDSKSDVKVFLAEDADNFIIEESSSIVNKENSLGKQDNDVPAAGNIAVPEKDLNITGDLEPSLSRPNTPLLSSRPQTPRNLQSSRPQTPRMPSRPSTPAHPFQRLSTPTSRPNTPQCPSLSRPRTPSINVPPSSRILSPASERGTTRLLKEEEDVKSIFITKQKEFHSLKKELDLKQQVVLAAFDNLRSLRDQLSHEGEEGCGEGLQLQELVVFNVADWTSEEISQLCRDAAASSTTDGAIELIANIPPMDECALADFDTKVLSVPAYFADLCLQAFTARQEVIDWVKELIEQNENGGGESLERIARYNTQGLELCEALRTLKSRSDEAVKSITQLFKQAFRERDALVTVGESLVREIARLRHDIETHTNAIKDLQSTRNEMDRSKASEEMRKEFDEERAARISAKDKLGSTEAQLRQARMRISKMDRQLREAEASIASLTSTVKNLEDQSRQKEVQLEARARKLRETLKTGEITSSQLAHQRDTLLSENQDLKQQVTTLTAQHELAVRELNNLLKASQNVKEKQCQVAFEEDNNNAEIEAELLSAKKKTEELKAKITELESKPTDLPTEREMDLWAELQSTKDTLRMTEDEVTACKREKVRFLETLTKITGTENKVGMQQKLAAELLSKEEILAKMQIQIRELTKNIKLNEHKVIQYEQYVRDLQARNRALTDGQEAPDGHNYQDLQQEIMNLKIALLEAVHRSEQLSDQLLQKDQQLEQQDKTSRAQARVIKKVTQVREELINMLKNKETEQSRELGALQQDLEHRMQIVEEVNKQIAAKADEIQELFKTLENKQQQIHRLEKIVLALEEQQRRAQAQRTRHEEKIATLEHELAESSSRKERKFLFF